MSEQEVQEPPYLIKLVEVRLYNPNFGNDRKCVCGHEYIRHFDWMNEDDEQAVGCKYCGCDFTEAADAN